MGWYSTKDINIYDIVKDVAVVIGDCPNCGNKMIRHIDLDKSGKKMPAFCPLCGYEESKKDYDLKLKEDQTFTLKARKNAALGAMTKYSVFSSADVTNASFSNFITLTQAEKTVFSKAKTIAKKMSREKVHSLLIGGTGRGKTHIAMSIVKEVWKLTDYGQKAIFLSVPELVNEMKLGIKMPDLAQKIDRTMSKISHGDFDILVIDDLGAERQTDYTISIIDTIAQAIEDKSVILTTNLTGPELIEKYRERFMSRLKSHGVGNSINFSNIEDHRGISY